MFTFIWKMEGTARDTADLTLKFTNGLIFGGLFSWYFQIISLLYICKAYKYDKYD